MGSANARMRAGATGEKRSTTMVTLEVVSKGVLVCVYQAHDALAVMWSLGVIGGSTLR